MDRRHFIAGLLATGFALKAEALGRGVRPALDGIDILPPSGKPKYAVTLLHGFSGNAESMRWLAKNWASTLSDALFILPNAPTPCHESSDPAAREWFASRARDPDSGQRAAQIRRIEPILNRYIDTKLEQYGIPDSRLAIVGISQGAMMALHTAPRRDRPCAAVVAYNGMLVDPQGLQNDNIVRMPIFAAHGTRDTVVDYSNLERVRRGYAAEGFDVQTASYDVGHDVTPASLKRGAEFIREQFTPKSILRPEVFYGA